jgi:hypothetical protein
MPRFLDDQEAGAQQAEIDCGLGRSPRQIDGGDEIFYFLT